MLGGTKCFVCLSVLFFLSHGTKREAGWSGNSTLGRHKEAQVLIIYFLFIYLVI